MVSRMGEGCPVDKHIHPNTGLELWCCEHLFAHDVCSFFLWCLIILKFCLYQSSYIAFLSAKFYKVWTLEMGNIDKHVYGKFEAKMNFWVLSCIATASHKTYASITSDAGFCMKWDPDLCLDKQKSDAKSGTTHSGTFLFWLVCPPCVHDS